MTRAVDTRARSTRVMALLVALALAFITPPAGQAASRGPTTGAPEPVVSDSTTNRPNIVVFYMDDVSPHDGRLWDDPARTPAIHDHFIEHGIEFTNAIGETPLCCPGRASLLTGLHTHNHGVATNDAWMLNTSVHVGKALKNAGYSTMFIGKYLNKNSFLSTAQWTEHGAGWTFLDVIYGFNGDFFGYQVRTKTGKTWYPNTHSTRMVAQRTIQRLRETPAEQPVFAVLSAYNLHQPNTPMPEFADDERCTGMEPWNPPNYNEADVSDKPAYIRALPLLRHTDGWPMEGYCREMLGIDWLVAQVVGELEAQGRLENTLLVFTADNGVSWGEHRRGQQKIAPYTTPVPLYMTWPANWGDSPRQIDEHTTNIDLAPTFCDLGGCTLAGYATGQAGADGVSLVPLIEDGASLGRDALLESSATWSAVRTTAQHTLGLWHYVELATGERELYDLEADPWELENRASDPAYAAVAAALADRLHDLLEVGRVNRPDASLGLKLSSPRVGYNVFADAVTEGQTLRRTGVKRNTSYDYFVAIENNTTALDSYVVRGTETGSSTLKVSYLVNGADVTSSVVGDGYTIANLGPGALSRMTVRIAVSGVAVRGNLKRVALDVESLSNPGARDVVRAIARR